MPCQAKELTWPVISRLAAALPILLKRSISGGAIELAPASPSCQCPLLLPCPTQTSGNPQRDEHSKQTEMSFNSQRVCFGPRRRRMLLPGLAGATTWRSRAPRCCGTLCRDPAATSPNRVLAAWCHNTGPGGIVCAPTRTRSSTTLGLTPPPADKLITDSRKKQVTPTPGSRPSLWPVVGKETCLMGAVLDQLPSGPTCQGSWMCWSVMSEGSGGGVHHVGSVRLLLLDGKVGGRGGIRDPVLATDPVEVCSLCCQAGPREQRRGPDGAQNRAEGEAASKELFRLLRGVTDTQPGPELTTPSAGRNLQQDLGTVCRGLEG